ncbi:MAG TPA: hypothetical protein VLA44_02490, partial [Clostridia bacterium]|nr:hypothetical protein [Clostridia bacterium]
DGRSSRTRRWAPAGGGGYFQRWPAASTRLELASAESSMTTLKVVDRTNDFMWIALFPVIPIEDR